MLHDFSYHSPESLDELLSLLDTHGEKAAVFSGGTDLFVAIRSGLATPKHVIDLKKVPDLSRLAFDEANGLHIGATVTVNQLVEYPTVRDRYSVLRVAGDELATFQLRNRATVVGNAVTASPCGDMSSPLLCLGATVTLTSVQGSRTMPINEFITGVKKTQIASNEIVSAITVPADHIDASGGYKKLKRIKGHDLGVVSVASVKSKSAWRFAISSAAPTPVLLEDFPLDVDVDRVQESAQRAISPIDDVRCTAEYRSFMVNVFIKRLVGEVA